MNFTTPRCAIALSALFICMPSLAGPGGGGYGSTPSWGTRYVPGDYPTIQSAIDAAASGDIIEVASGTYEENLSVCDKSLTIRCLEGSAEAPMAYLHQAGGIGGNGPILFVVDSSNVTVQGFQFQSATDSTTPAFDGRAIAVTGASLTVNDCSFHIVKTSWIDVSTIVMGPVHFGAAINADSSTVKVNDSSFNYCKAPQGGAIYSKNSDLVVRNSTFEECGDMYQAGAICSTGSGSVSLTQCLFEYCESVYGSAAVSIYGQLDAQIHRCVFDSCESDDSVVKMVTSTDWVTHTLTQNYFRDCGDIFDTPYKALTMNSISTPLSTASKNLFSDSGYTPAKLLGLGGGDFVVWETSSDCVSDVNFDGYHSVADLLDILTYWSECDPICDLNKSGVVDFDDLMELVTNFDSNCGH
jgi:hypothetical protein